MHKSVTSNTNYSPIVIACSKSSPPWDKCPKKWGLANLKQKTNNVLLPSGCIICFDRFSTRFQEFIVLYYFSAACLILLSPSPFYLTDLKSIQKLLADGFSYKRRPLKGFCSLESQQPASTYSASCQSFWHLFPGSFLSITHTLCYTLQKLISLLRVKVTLYFKSNNYNNRTTTYFQTII